MWEGVRKNMVNLEEKNTDTGRGKYSSVFKIGYNLSHLWYNICVQNLPKMVLEIIRLYFQKMEMEFDLGTVGCMGWYNV